MKFVLSIIGIAFSLALQASPISSEEIGNFFTLPSWMQQAAANGVSSFNTPGSDPQDGGGWYVSEYTNGVVLANTWKIYDGEDTLIEDFDNPEYQGGGIWYQAYPPRRVEPQEYEIRQMYPDYIEGDENIETMEWDVIYEDPYAIRSYHAIRDRSISKIPTGRKVPRSPRLFPDIMTGVNSTFEGFFERQYYAMEAQSNVWDIAAYGPRQGRHLFWFDPSDRTGGGSSSYDWDYSTNRTITTRRLFGWERVDSLADFILNPMYYRGMQLTGSERPNWIESLDTDQSDSRCYWSTTDAKVFQGTQLIPDLDGTQDPFSSSVDWSRCSQCFACLDRDQVWDNSGNADNFGYVTNNFPTCKLMKRLDFRSGDSEAYWSLRNCAPDIINGVTMGHLIETNFPNADGWAITNRTRRLFSDCLCCMNQLLSLMDRTYHVPRIDYPTTGTNFTFKNTYYVRGLANIGLSYDEGTGEAHVLTTSPISWTYSDGHMTTSSYSVVSDGNAYHFRASETSTSAVVTVDDPAEQYLLFGGVTDELINEIITKSGVGSTTGNVDIYVSPQLHPSGYRYTVFAYGMPDWYVSHPSGFIGGAFVSAPTNLECLVEMSYSREYSYSRTTGRIGLGPTQPGWESYDRVVQNNYGLILGRHLRKGDNYTSLGCLPFSQYDSYCDWYSWQNTYFNRSGLIDLFPDRISDLLDYFQTQYGGDPENPEGTIEIGQDAWDVQNSVRVINPSATVGLSGVSQSRAIVSIGEGGQVTIIGRETWPDGTQYPSVPYFVDMFKISLTYEETHDSPGEDEKDPIALDARFGLITRTDWQWKALQRVDE